MKDSLSGSIVNEIEVNERWEQQRREAIELLKKMKLLEELKKKKLIRENSRTIVSEGFYELMIIIRK